MNQSKLQPALIGGVVAGFVSAIPFLNCLNCACCALILGGGFLATYLYLKGAPPSAEPPYGDAAILGVMTGIVAALTSTIISIPFSLVMSSFGGGPDPEMLEQFLGNADLPPEVMDMLAGLMSGGVSVGAIFLNLIMSLVIFTVFAVIGSLIGVAVLHKKMAAPAPPTTAGAPPPPPQY